VTVTGGKGAPTSPVTVKAASDRSGGFAADVLQDGKAIGKVVANADGGYVYSPVKNQYMKVDKGSTSTAIAQSAIADAGYLLPLPARLAIDSAAPMLRGDHPYEMIVPSKIPAGYSMSVTVSDQPDTVNGKPVEKITQTLSVKGQSMSELLYVDPKTELPVRLAYGNGAASSTSFHIDFSEYKLGGTTATASAFQYTPPATATAYTPPPPPKEQPVLANGATAPDFAVQDVNGKTVHLADFAGKVVVIDYWATWCGPCQSALPGTDKVAREYQAKGVVFLPVCSWDDKSAFTPWVNDRKTWSMTFYFDPAGRGKDSIAGTLYKVSGIPTQFVIGKDGKVAWSTVGYDSESGEKNLAAAIDKAMAAS
jgi:thiol-disulfide isomerase/thioredoxin